ncbi:sodium/potassium-transporting ATPase subunit beta-like [Homarus americanus]|uniref:sodium/potassium-transporting ATPase subunit beta-like n=1 Tax=Homarus americanus TaxID=6706 RepID=UPI001C4958B4|nr:sodium/potassium-transporting ATPase subunit beta-like [Homarus americanus]
MFRYLIVVVVTFVTCNSDVTAEKEGLFVIPSGNIKFNPNQKSTYEEEISSLNQFFIDYYNNATKADDTQVITCPPGFEPNATQVSEKEGLFIIPSGNIKFNPNQKSTYEEEISSLNQFIKDYYYNATKADDTQVIACPPGVEPNATQVCILPEIILGHECNPENVWNYKTTSPCIILSYNGKTTTTTTKFDPYDDIEELPNQMPHRLKNEIKDITYYNNNIMKEVIWVSCTLLGIHSYYGPGFPKSFFSNTNLTGYRKPIVALQLNLKDEINTTVEITCNMWAKGIDNEKNPETSVKFTVTVEKN